MEKVLLTQDRCIPKQVFYFVLMCLVLWFGYIVPPLKYSSVLKGCSSAGDTIERRLDHEGTSFTNGVTPHEVTAEWAIRNWGIDSWKEEVTWGMSLKSTSWWICATDLSLSLFSSIPSLFLAARKWAVLLTQPSSIIMPYHQSTHSNEARRPWAETLQTISQSHLSVFQVVYSGIFITVMEKCWHVPLSMSVLSASSEKCASY